MEKAQMEVIVGLFAGVQTAIVHVCKLLEGSGLGTSEQIAESFRGTADGLPETVHMRPLVHMVLMQIASGIASSQPMQQEATDKIRDLLH